MRIIRGSLISQRGPQNHYEMGSPKFYDTGTGDKSENVSNTGIGLGLRLRARARG